MKIHIALIAALAVLLWSGAAEAGTRWLISNGRTQSTWKKSTGGVSASDRDKPRDKDTAYSPSLPSFAESQSRVVTQMLSVQSRIDSNVAAQADVLRRALSVGAPASACVQRAQPIILRR